MPSTSGAPSVPVTTTWSSQIFSTIVRGRGVAGVGLPSVLRPLADASSRRAWDATLSPMDSHDESELETTPSGATCSLANSPEIARMRRVFRHVPTDPRCKLCLSP